MNLNIRLRREFLKTAHAVAYTAKPTEELIELHLASVEALLCQLSGDAIRIALVPSGMAIAAAATATQRKGAV